MWNKIFPTHPKPAGFVTIEEGIPQQNKFQIRVKTIGEFALKALGITLATTTIATISLAAIGIIPIIVAIGTTASCATIIGLALLGKVTKQLPEPFKAICQLINSIGYEALSGLTLGFLSPLNLEQFDPKDENQINKLEIPVLFIHGFLGMSNNWVYHKRRLQEKGYKNIFTINLGDPRKSIGSYAEHVREKIDEICKLTGRADIILVCHSMGGLVAKEFLYSHNKNHVRVRKIITLGTPLAGTKIALLASWVSKSAEEMVPDSSLLQKLQQEEEKDTITPYHHVGTKVDLIILPRESATAGGEKSDTQIVELEETPHAGYLFSDTAADIVVEEVLKTATEG